MANTLRPNDNSLLRRLSPAEVQFLGPLEDVSLELRQTLEAAEEESRYVYFIVEGVASVVSTSPTLGGTEIGIIGREGVTGLGIVYGDRRSPFETFVQVEGFAMRCESSHLARAMAQSETIRSMLTSYARAFSIQVAATAIANGRAKLEERLARWLLMVGDRTGPAFNITHEFLAVMIAVRRSGVTLAIQDLEGRGLIRAGRGNIRIIDRDGLIACANGSYGLAEREYHRLMGDI